MADRPQLRLFTFRWSGPGATLDSAIRGEVLPALRAEPGILEAFVGRRGAGDSGERAIATAWRSAAAAPEGPLEAFVIENAIPGVADERARLDILPVAIVFRAARPVEARILRVFRGQARPGELDAYLADVERSTGPGGDGTDGLLALFLAVDPPVRFITVSAWASWTAIETATGGNVRQPLATRNMNRLAASAVAHYEIIPNS